MPRRKKNRNKRRAENCPSDCPKKTKLENFDENTKPKQEGNSDSFERILIKAQNQLKILEDMISLQPNQSEGSKLDLRGITDKILGQLSIVTKYSSVFEDGTSTPDDVSDAFVFVLLDKAQKGLIQLADLTDDQLLKIADCNPDCLPGIDRSFIIQCIKKSNEILNLRDEEDDQRIFDTENIRFVFAAVKDTILQSNLKEYNLV